MSPAAPMCEGGSCSTLSGCLKPMHVLGGDCRKPEGKGKDKVLMAEEGR